MVNASSARPETCLFLSDLCLPELAQAIYTNRSQQSGYNWRKTDATVIATLVATTFLEDRYDERLTPALRNAL